MIQKTQSFYERSTIIILQIWYSFCFFFNGVHADYHQNQILR
jgi:hypothetical protein